MIGLSIRVKNVEDNYLYKIFNKIEVSKYVWKVVDDDIMFDNNDRTQGLFGKAVMSGDEFYRCISKDKYYMIFADIKAYPIGVAHSEISTLNDYLNSDCQLILLCADVIFIDLYCKDKDILEKVYKNCIDNNFEEVDIITEENNSRTRMSVW